ncbi:type II secretion system protein E (GspE) [Peptoclostridium litorale DSM 5388]|uniref:Type II secretion system protein E n=1 Tax=Peptoclostridium litorale DSM 5388 TaxID=1121324 RepID=A0A069R9R5_PEPLI|nr:GspE/PulE family protein [Peptoclostridium litorale]KDR93809.1 type II secretion system protein E [Peptoclostridium litorale DSM 5388]SIN86261.1 type II secretion system protein E (GspE) [Peptoclostridium litorale DSM 5388]
MKNMIKLGDLLLKVGKISQEQLENALDTQKKVQKKLGEVLTDLGYVTNRDIIEVLEYQLGIPHVNLETYDIDINAPKLINEKFARENILVPVKISDEDVMVAMADPFDIIAISQLERMLGKRVSPAIATDDDIKNTIEKYYSSENVRKAVEEFKREYEFSDEHIDQNLLNEVNDAPIVRLVDSIIMQAVQSRASDIHIEPTANSLRIRFRVDGELSDVMKPEKNTHGAIVTRIKIMAKMNIAEKRLPQDGRIEMNEEKRNLDLRVSTIPTIYGEKVVIRVVDNTKFLKKKSELGLSHANIERFENLLRLKNGIILVTGPTGSGKSTTLYSAMNELNDFRKNIVTVEDPVEYRMENINQIQVNSKAGLTFSSGLRSILRQDPDIIMVGEIRDHETAEMAMRAAITGHLVLSTLHTNDAASSISRLLDMGIKAYLVSAAVKGIVAQRLVRTICPYCEEEYVPSEDELALLSHNSWRIEGKPIKRGKGCRLCNYTGYRGRKAVHEILVVDRHIRQMIFDESKIESIKDYSIKQGMRTLQDNCIGLIIDGETTIEEYVRSIHT